MKIVLQKSTGQIFTAFSGVEPDDETLYKNHSDINRDDLEIKTVTPKEHSTINKNYLKSISEGYKQLRASEYPRITDVTVALAEKAEGDSTMWDEITAQREAVKSKYPKP